MTTPWLRTHPALARPDWTHGWTTATGPDFRGDPALHHAAPVAELVATVGLDDGAWLRQVHGNAVLRADGPGCRGEADALWTDRSGLGVVGRSADCPLVLVAMSGSRPRWGFAHASWRSTVAGITAGLLAAMTADGGDPATATAVICPSAGPCCYEVGTEVRDAALAGLGSDAGDFFAPHGGNWILDLWAANRAQLVGAGVPPTAVHIVGTCTICGPEYPSYRREGSAAGRFAAVIGHSGQR